MCPEGSERYMKTLGFNISSVMGEGKYLKFTSSSFLEVPPTALMRPRANSASKKAFLPKESTVEMWLRIVVQLDCNQASLGCILA